MLTERPDYKYMSFNTGENLSQRKNKNWPKMFWFLPKTTVSQLCLHKTLKSRLLLSLLWYFLPNCKNSFEDATMTKEMDTRVRDCRRSGKTVICQICFIFIFLRRQLQTQFKGLLPFVHCAVINFSLSLSLDTVSSLIFWRRQMNKLGPWHIVYILQQ